jgi:hypothetical protein
MMPDADPNNIINGLRYGYSASEICDVARQKAGRLSVMNREGRIRDTLQRSYATGLDRYLRDRLRAHRASPTRAHPNRDRRRV